MPDTITPTDPVIPVVSSSDISEAPCPSPSSELSTDASSPSMPPTASSSPPRLHPSPSTSLLAHDDSVLKPAHALTYDSLLELAGVGRFHYQLLLLCGWANAADAIEILAASFIMYAAKDDLFLTDSEKGWIGAMVFLGMLVGGWLWGSLADRIGRKTCLILALLLNSLGGVMAAFVGSYHGMLICRFVAGLGVGGSIPVIFTYFIEFLPTSSRGQYMVYLAWFWMVGAIFTAALAWIVIPLNLSTSFFISPFHSWRLFTFLCALPSLTCAALLTWCPESPRFLLTQRQNVQAKRILSNMFAINHPHLFENVSMQTEWCGLCCLAEGKELAGYNVVGEDEVDPILEVKEDVATRKEGENGGMKAAFQRELADLSLISASESLTVPSYYEEFSLILDKTRNLFTGPSLSHSFKLCIVWFGLSFGFYGITLWIPETFSHLNPNTKSVLDPYSAAFLSATCNLPGNILSVYTVRSMGRSVTLATSIGASTLAVFLVPLASSPLSVTVVLSAFTLVSVGAWNALNISTTELYGTEVRSTAFGVLAAVGRLGAIMGNVLFGEFIGGSVLVPMMITAGFLGTATLAAWRLKETKDEVLT